MRNIVKEEQAIVTAQQITEILGLDDKEPIGIVLGTGLGDKLILDHYESMSMKDLPGFSWLQSLSGHAREIKCGYIGNKKVIALSGRIHLNEDPGNPAIFGMVRLQIEMLIKLGVKKLILTCAAGLLPHTKLQIGNLVVIDGFITPTGLQMPLWGGEFCSPEDSLSERLQKIALEVGKKYQGGIKTGGHAMVLGPNFEGRKYDKQNLRRNRASVVGMSIQPEACIASLYPGVEVLAVAFVTNDAVEIHSHEENMEQVKKFSEPLSEFLKELIINI